MSVVDCRDAVMDREVDVLLADLAGSVPADVVRELVSSVRMISLVRSLLRRYRSSCIDPLFSG